MRKFLQTTLLRMYRVIEATGLMRLTVFQRLFEIGYDLYKSKLEATELPMLRRHVLPGTSVIDVGANIGFYTLRFSDWVTFPGKVIAIEPGHDNFLLLERACLRHGTASRVDLVEAAAAEVNGTLHLVVNPHHPADHRLGDEGVPVAAFTIDHLMAERGWPTVSLMKVDVQGAEIRVLRGATQLLRRCSPAIYIEIDDDSLTKSGYSADEVFTTLKTLGYDMYDVDETSDAPLDRAAADRKRAATGYADFLFKPGSRPA